MRGPAFISVGDDEKLAKFLDLNPAVPRANCFVDDTPDFAAYEAAGFGKIGDVVPDDVSLKPPGFGIKQWFDYLSNVASLSPVRKDKPLEFPQGVLRLGGTFVLDNDDVAFAWADPTPGQHPPMVDVLKAARVP